jgi:hypothetical protein
MSITEFSEPKPISPIPYMPPKPFYGGESIWGNKTTKRGMRWIDNRVNFVVEMMKFMARWEQKGYAGKRQDLLYYDEGEEEIIFKTENLDFTLAEDYGTHEYGLHEGSWHADPEVDGIKEDFYWDDVFWGIAGGYYFGGVEDEERVNFQPAVGSFKHSLLENFRDDFNGDEADFDADGEVDGDINDSLPAELYYKNFFKAQDNSSYSFDYANPIDYSNIWGIARYFVNNNAKSWADLRGAINNPSIYQLANSMYSDTGKYPNSGDVPVGYEQYDYRQIFDTPEKAFYLAVSMMESMRRIAFFMTEIFGPQFQFYDGIYTNVDDSVRVDNGMMNNFNSWMYGINDDPAYNDNYIYQKTGDKDSDLHWKGSETGMLNKNIFNMAIKMQHHILSSLYAYFYGQFENDYFGFPYRDGNNLQNGFGFDQESLRVRDFRYWLAENIHAYYDIYKTDHSFFSSGLSPKLVDLETLLINLTDDNLDDSRDDLIDKVDEILIALGDDERSLELVTAGFRLGSEYEYKYEGDKLKYWDEVKNGITNASTADEIKNTIFGLSNLINDQKVISLINDNGSYSKDIENDYFAYLINADGNPQNVISLLYALEDEESYISSGAVIEEFNAEFSMGNKGELNLRPIKNADKDNFSSGYIYENITMGNVKNDHEIYVNYSAMDQILRSEGRGGWDQTWGRNPFADDPYGHERHLNTQFQYWYSDLNHDGDGDDRDDENEWKKYWGYWNAEGEIYWSSDGSNYSKTGDSGKYVDYIWGVHDINIMEKFLNPQTEQVFSAGLYNNLNGFLYDKNSEDWEQRKENHERSEIAKMKGEAKEAGKKALRKKIASQMMRKKQKADALFRIKTNKEMKKNSRKNMNSKPKVS